MESIRNFYIQMNDIIECYAMPSMVVSRIHKSQQKIKITFFWYLILMNSQIL